MDDFCLVCMVCIYKVVRYIMYILMFMMKIRIYKSLRIYSKRILFTSILFIVRLTV